MKLAEEVLAELPPAPPWHTETGIADLTLESAIRRHAVIVLGYTHGNISWAADEMGIGRGTLRHLLQRWGVARKKGEPIPELALMEG